MSGTAPSRKADPGEHFPWQRLAGEKIGLWPLGAGDASAPVAGSLHAIGYNVADLRAAITAFQRRWMPERVDGVEDEAVRGRADAVAQAYSAG